MLNEEMVNLLEKTIATYANYILTIIQ